MLLAADTLISDLTAAHKLLYHLTQKARNTETVTRVTVRQGTRHRAYGIREQIKKVA